MTWVAPQATATPGVALACTPRHGLGGAWTPGFSCPNFGLSPPGPAITWFSTSKSPARPEPYLPAASGLAGVSRHLIQRRPGKVSNADLHRTLPLPGQAQGGGRREKAALLIDEPHPSTPGAGPKCYGLLRPFLLVLSLRHCLPALQGRWEMLPH